MSPLLSYLGLLATVAILVGLLYIGSRVLRGYVGAALRGAGGIRVLHRVTLGPRQGIAVLRLGPNRTLVVSLGEGGVRPLTELTPSERDQLLAESPGDARAGTSLGEQAVPLLRSFGEAFRQATGLGGSAGRGAAGSASNHAASSAASSAAREAAGGERTTAAPRRGTGRSNLFALLLVVGLALAGSARLEAQGAPKPAPGTTVPVSGATPASRVSRGPAAGPASGGAAEKAERADKAIGGLAPSIDLKVGKGDGGLRLSGTVGVVIMMGLLTLLPTLVLMMTGFTRILIVLHFVKQAIGTPQAPPPQLVAALALLITGFVMTPTLSDMNRTALTPWMDGQIEQVEMMRRASVPLREFMLRQVHDQDLDAFVELSHIEPPKSEADVPLVVVTAAFVTSELKTAFQIGFLIFLPFIVIDVAVAAVLMSMGMFMVPPAMIALPFKLLLFVLVDGWTLVITGLAQSFH